MPASGCRLNVVELDTEHVFLSISNALEVLLFVILLRSNIVCVHFQSHRLSSTRFSRFSKLDTWVVVWSLLFVSFMTELQIETQQRHTAAIYENTSYGSNLFIKTWSFFFSPLCWTLQLTAEDFTNPRDDIRSICIWLFIVLVINSCDITALASVNYAVCIKRQISILVKMPVLKKFQQHSRPIYIYIHI